jgi:hypothetical protein
LRLGNLGAAKHLDWCEEEYEAGTANRSPITTLSPMRVEVAPRRVGRSAHR